MTSVLTPTPTMIPVARPYIGAEEEQAVLSVLRSGWITQGPRVADFESRFAAYVGTEHAVAVSSCTTALQLALIACGVGIGDEVICPSLSFIATANAIVHTGATPVFADIDLDTYNVDPKSVEAALSPRTKAILIVHQIGLPANLNAFKELASRQGIALIEDAACAIGSEYEGQLIGQPVGDIACFSFHPRKILTTGEGGMMTTRDPQMAERLRRLRQHSMSLSDVARHSSSKVALETYDEVGYNYRMTDMQAAVGIVQLDRLASFLARRRRLAQRYSDALGNLPSVHVPQAPKGCRPNYQSYMVRLLGDSALRRDQIMQDLLEKQISTRRGIMAIHRELPYRSSERDRSLPNTNLVADSALILPLFHQMTEAEQDYVVETLIETL